MNTVTAIDTHLIPYIDVKKIIQTIRDVSRLASFRQDRADVLQDRAQRVAAYLNNIDQTMRESFPVLLTALNSASGQSYFDALAELNDALARNDLTSQDRDMVSEEILNIKGNIEAMLAGVEAKFTDRSRFLENEVRSLYKVEIDERADEPLKVARERKARLLVALNDHSLSKATCVEQRDTLIKAQDVIREFNLADMYKDYIPDSKALDGLDMENPKKEAVKQGVELVRKVLGVVSGGIKYIELATSRNNLDKEIQALTQLMEGLNKNLQTAEDALSDINAVVEIGRQRRVVGEEVIAVVGVWLGFSMSLDKLKSTDYTQSELSRFLNRYKTHLEGLTADYNSIMIN
ncbi:alpha-xenorhabdolysin family binary toxin subunit B [Pseudomonas sp. TH03]|uniref:alpha-xenorhabdolysin family binary toxin subunit B n=1 Tax=Pseudomonas sp. TH03 TaxID=2796369 RepID=UPI001912C212|nr:alpha-xenorhabdolysin family binary toxin subunit B [Pseudomonas sp. TH03]MBK5554033.1 alpha-xenorhabdolysin family binary toxin subunit B [Pseudomonas sp. TH03]